MSNYHLLTTREMLTRGYHRAQSRNPNDPQTCKLCGEEIEWWKTKNDKSVPYNLAVRDDVERTCHFATCTGKKEPDTQQRRPATISETEDMRRIVATEYRCETEGEAGYRAPEHIKNWLIKKLVEARLELAHSRGRN